MNLLGHWKFSGSTKAGGRRGVKTVVPLLLLKGASEGAIGSGLNRIIMVDVGGVGSSSEGILSLPRIDGHGPPGGPPN